VKEDQSHQTCCNIGCLSWTSVFAGALVALGLSFLFNLFGLAIGLSAYTTSAEGLLMLTAGGYIGIAISVMITMFLAGWVSAYLGRANCTCKKMGILYGFLAWSLALVLSICLASSVGRYITLQRDALMHHEMVSMPQSSSMGMKQQATSNNGQSVAGSEAKMSLSVKETQNLGKALFLTFLLFLAGAIMAAYGGYTAMKSHCCKPKPPITP